MLKHNDLPSLLKKQSDSEIDELIKMAYTYLDAYDRSRDWGFIPTVQHALGQISLIHMRRSKNGS
jgi:hypothetical protein